MNRKTLAAVFALTAVILLPAFAEVGVTNFLLVPAVEGVPNESYFIGQGDELEVTAKGTFTADPDINTEFRFSFTWSNSTHTRETIEEIPAGGSAFLAVADRIDAGSSPTYECTVTVDWRLKGNDLWTPLTSDWVTFTSD